MKDTYKYNHNFDDYSVELELELDVYVPRHADDDDVAEIEILNATVMEDVGDYKKGQAFPLELIDSEEVTDDYLGGEHYNDDAEDSRIEDAIEEDRNYRYGEDN